jgi:phosphoglycolate phosphatase-like HAD superfamily hydrolase
MKIINKYDKLNMRGNAAPMFKHILWDFDGTLFDTYPAMTIAFQKALLDEKIQEDKDTILKLMKISLGHAVDHYKKIFSISDNFIERYHFYEKTLDKRLLPPMPYAVEVCRGIKANRGDNFIFTHRGDYVFKLLGYYSMLDYFTEIVSLDYRFKRKPDPSGFNYIIEKYSLNKAQVLAVGDRELDILAGHNAGIKACFLDDKILQKCTSADYRINSLKDLQGIVDINSF